MTSLKSLLETIIKDTAYGCGTRNRARAEKALALLTPKESGDLTARIAHRICPIIKHWMDSSDTPKHPCKKCTWEVDPTYGMCITACGSVMHDVARAARECMEVASLRECAQAGMTACQDFYNNWNGEEAMDVHKHIAMAVLIKANVQIKYDGDT